MRLLIKISACMLIVAVVSVCLLLRCPDTSELNKLLNGDGTVSFDYYTITPDRIAITVTNKSSVEYLRVQFLRTVKTGRAGSLNSWVSKRSHSIKICLRLRSDRQIVIFAHLVEHNATIGLMINHNIDCYDDDFAYWVPLTIPIDPELKKILDNVILTDT